MVIYETGAKIKGFDKKVFGLHLLYIQRTLKNI